MNSTCAERRDYTGFDTLNSVFTEDREKLIKQMRLAKVNGTTESMDVRCVIKDEQYRWFNVCMKRVDSRSDAGKSVMCLLITAADDLHEACDFVKNSSDILKIVSQNGDIILWEYNLSSKMVRRLYAYGSIKANKDEINWSVETFIENGRILPADSKLFVEMYHKIDGGASAAECTVRMMNDVQGKYEWQHMVLTRQEQDGIPTDIAVGFSANIELQKEAEARYECENRLRQELVKDAVIYYRINLSNHMVEEMYSEAMDTTGIQLPVSLDKLLADGLLDGCYELDRQKMDDVFNADKMLEKYGIQMDYAENGKVGIEIFRKNPQKYMSVFMDIHMPVMGGMEASELIRHMNTEVPIIALTGDKDAAIQKQMQDIGISKVLEKPLNTKKFYEVIYECI